MNDPKFHTLKLFASFQAVWGWKWLNNFQTNPEIIEIALNLWSAALKDLTLEQITKALEKASMTMAWPPSIADFRSLAKNIPSLATCYKLAKDSMGKDSTYIRNAFARDVFEKIGSYDFRQLPEKELFLRFESTYNAMLAEKLLS